jgi:hypothetical protein
MISLCPSTAFPLTELYLSYINTKLRYPQHLSPMFHYHIQTTQIKQIHVFLFKNLNRGRIQIVCYCSLVFTVKKYVRRTVKPSHVLPVYDCANFAKFFKLFKTTATSTNSQQQCCGSGFGALFTPGSGIRNGFFRDPRSRILDRMKP